MFVLYTKKVLKDVKAKMPKITPQQSQKSKPKKPNFKKKNQVNNEPSEHKLNMLKNKFNS